MRRMSLDALRDLNQLQADEMGHPETLTRISQYELAFRMQMQVPGILDIEAEDASDWYRQECRREYELITGDLYPRMVELLGREDADGLFKHRCRDPQRRSGRVSIQQVAKAAVEREPNYTAS